MMKYLIVFIFLVHVNLTMASNVVLFKNVRIFDGNNKSLAKSSNVLVKGNIISKISTKPIDSPKNARIINGKIEL